MAIHRDYKRIIMLLIAGIIAALWIQINYDFESGAIYIAMMIIAIIGYALAEQIGVVKK